MVPTKAAVANQIRFAEEGAKASGVRVSNLL